LCQRRHHAHWAAPLEISAQQWQDVIDVNLTAVFNTLAVTVPAIRTAGVVALAKMLANEVAAEGIRVNGICPGAVATPRIKANEELFKLFRPDLDHSTLQDCEPVFKTLMPMGGPWLAPEDVSNMVVFLASDEASSVTGTAMSVDQGTVNR
jgi:(+)-trans-carveol dehydrogenase